MGFKQLSEIKTKRLVLRKLNAEDLELIFELRSSEEVTKYIARPLYKDIEEGKLFLDKTINSINKNEVIVWTIRLKDSLIPIGTICLWNFSEDRKTAEVGYDMLPEYHNKGFMSEAIRSVINFGFNKLKLNTIEAYTSKHNLRSIRLLEKNHFVLQSERKDEEYPDNIIFALNNFKK